MNFIHKWADEPFMAWHEDRQRAASCNTSDGRKTVVSVPNKEKFVKQNHLLETQLQLRMPFFQ